MARARRLSEARAAHAPLSRFLVGQSDVILMLCGGQALWYITHRKRRGAHRGEAAPAADGPRSRAIHQLRQVFTALLLGTELLGRKASQGRVGEISRLAVRLNRIVRDGIAALAVLGEPCPADLIDELGAPIRIDRPSNGTHP